MIAERIVRPGSTITLDFATYDSSGGSVTISGFALTDIEIFRDGSATTRASDSGYALLDTDGIDVASQTGIHGASVDLADNSDSGFFRPGSRYKATIASITCDGQTVNVLVDRFYIGYPGAMLDTYISGAPTSQTEFVLANGPEENDALNGMWAIIHDGASAVQQARVLILDYVGASKTVTLAAAPTFTIAANDGISVMGPAPLQPATTGQTLAIESDGMAHADVKEIEGSDATDQIRDSVVDDATRIDASALNTATGTTIPAILDDTDLIDDGTSGLAKIATDVAAILVDTADMQPKLGTPSASLAADIAAVLARTPSATSITNMNTVFATDFAANYNTTDDAWVVKLGDYAHGGTSAAVTVASVQCGGTLNVDGAVTFGSTFAVSDTVTFVSGLVAAITGNITGNLSGSVGSVTAGVTVTTNNDKTGYSLSSTGLDATTLPANLITASSIAANAFTSAKFASDYTDRLETDILAILEGNPVTDFTAIPAGTPTYSEALGMVAAAILNKVVSDRTAGKSYIHDSDNVVIGEATITDDGTTFTRTKYAAP